MKKLLASLVILSLLVTGCKGSKDVDSPVTPIQQHNGSSLNQEDALRVLTQELSKKLEYTLYFLQEAKLGDSTVYAFQRIKDNGETTTIDFVHSKTGKVYYDSLELLLDEFNNTEDKDQYIAEKYINRNIYYIEMKPLKDIDDNEITWGTYIANENPYPTLEEAKQAIIKVLGENHPTLSLLGKELVEVEKITKQAPETEVLEGEYGNSYEVTKISLEDMEIHFNYKNIATDILLKGSQEILGVKIGDTFDEIIEVLGLPDRLGKDLDWEQKPESEANSEDGYTMYYNFGEFSIEFHAEGKEEPTTSALLLLKKI